MDKIQKNDYGSLCTEMYEILHEKAPEKELAFYPFLCGKRATNFGTHVRERSVFDPVFGKGF